MGGDARRGRAGERAAAAFLRRRGWRVLARNWRGAGGELDLVVARGDTLAFCEIKTRSDERALGETLTALQRVRIVRAAEAFLAVRPDLAGRTARFDLLTVRASAWRRSVRHLPGAFEPHTAVPRPRRGWPAPPGGAAVPQASSTGSPA
jgi:putative endonuclease